MIQTKAKLIKNIAVTKNYYKIIISCPRIAREARPGQFLQVKLSDRDEPLLRRPFSIHRVSQANIEILYEVLGKGTEMLSHRKVGEYMDIIGPLGRGFTDRHKRGAIPILVAGGMGVAPLIFLAENLVKAYKGKVIVLTGARTRSRVLCEREFKRIGCDTVETATDDGSGGLKGRVTELLENFLYMFKKAGSIGFVRVYACGPRPMLREISRVSGQYGIPAQISLEEHMACGIGACLGCVVKAREGYKRVCKEGPVFSADEIVWE